MANLKCQDCKKTKTDVTNRQGDMLTCKACAEKRWPTQRGQRSNCGPAGATRSAHSGQQVTPTGGVTDSHRPVSVADEAFTVDMINSREQQQIVVNEYIIFEKHHHV